MLFIATERNERPEGIEGRRRQAQGNPVVKRGIATRIGKLEQRLGKGQGEMFILALPEGIVCDAALAKLGLTPSVADLVIVFSESGNAAEPKLLHRCKLVR